VSGREAPEPYVHADVAVGEVLVPYACDVVAVGGALEPCRSTTVGADGTLLTCWGPSTSEGPQKQDLTVFLEYNV
jgi:hypothetical protein